MKLKKMHKIKKCQGEYSIWLIPDGKNYTNLSHLICKLSEKYNSPFFEPHVTLIGNLSGKKEEIISKSSKLASQISPYKIKISNPAYLNEYFKSLFLKVEKTKEVMDANLKAKEIFSYNKESEYFPHLSLMYGNSSPDIKEKIISKLEKINLEFKVEELYLFSTAGKPENWYEIEKFDLKS